MRLPWSRKKEETGNLIACPRCNAPAPSDKPFCEACGARIAPPPSCSLCGTLLEPGSRFCPSCGTMIGASKDKPLAESPKKTPEKKPRAPVGGKVQEKSASETEQQPDDRMMVPEKPEVRGDLPDRESGPKPGKKTPPPPPSRTTLPPSGRSWGLPALQGKNIRLIAIIFVLIIAGAALISTGILSLPFASSPETLPASDTSIATTAPARVAATIVTPAATETPVPVASLVPGPTQTLPAHLDIVLQEERDPRTRMISVEYMGGKGQYGVREIFVRLTRSDGEVLTGSFKPIQVGSSIELQGTEQVDRLEVIVRYNSGEEYTVIDRVFEYKIRTA